MQNLVVSVHGMLIKAYPGGDGHFLYFNYGGGFIGTHSYQSSLVQFIVCRLFLNKVGTKKNIPEAQYQLFFFSPFFSMLHPILSVEKHIGNIGSPISIQYREMKILEKKNKIFRGKSPYYLVLLFNNLYYY